MKNSLDILKELVIKEATNLKKYATKKELNKLNYGVLLSLDKEFCIYGQMTGNCDSPRAIKLMEESCEKVYSSNHGISGHLQLLDKNPADISRSCYWSPIERFIGRWENKIDNNRALIAFLRNETETLILK